MWRGRRTSRSTKTVPSPKALAASRRADATASTRPPGSVTTRMPRPPPPKAAFTSAGKPTSVATRAARSAGRSSSMVMPGSTGTPASAMSALAAVFDPIARIAAGGGPTKVRPAVAHASAKSAFSERKP